MVVVAHKKINPAHEFKALVNLSNQNPYHDNQKENGINSHSIKKNKL